MKKYKLKKWVIPTIYALSIGVIVMSVLTVGKFLLPEDKVEEPVRFVSESTISNNEETVVNVSKSSNESIIRPYVLESVSVAKNFYDKDGNEETQINSLIYYKNTYMQNTGVLYTNGEKFDVICVLDGTVTSVTKDEILGNVVEVMHNNELITVYSCLDEVFVKAGDKVKQNSVLGNSGQVNIDKGYENALLFEVNYRGTIINPIKFYDMKVSDLME